MKYITGSLNNKFINIINFGYNFWNLVSSFVKYQDIHENSIKSKHVNHISHYAEL